MNPPSDNKATEFKWPLTHGERVVELQDALQDPRFFRFHENIRAAIEYHQRFNQQELCSPQLIYFQNGRIVPENERGGAVCWMEVCTCHRQSGSPELTFCRE